MGTGTCRALQTQKTLVTPFKNYKNKISNTLLMMLKIRTIVDIDRKLTVEQDGPGIAQKLHVPELSYVLILSLADYFKGLVVAATLYIYLIFSVAYGTFIITFLQYGTFIQIHSPRPLDFLIACSLRWKNFPGMPSQDSNSGMPYSRPQRTTN
jgi:hypothetical protein